MRYTKRKLLSIFVVLNCCVAFCERTITDSARVYYRQSRSSLDLTLSENERVLDRLTVVLQDICADSTKRLVLLRLTGNASPEGAYDANFRLAEKRAVGVWEYLRKRVTIPDSVVVIRSNGIDWAGLTYLVEQTSSVPFREEVLEVLRHTPVWICTDGKIADGRKRQLGMLHGGVPYGYVREFLFPELRNTCIEWSYVEREEEAFEATPEPESVPFDEVSENEACHEAGIEDVGMDSACVFTEKRRTCDGTHRLAVKTNLLYDVAAMPSLEVEYRINDKWSVNVEGEVAWWARKSRHKYYQIATISPEIRYWFATRKAWHGHYAGLFAGGSWYDLENGARGYKGEIAMAGLSYGYMFPVGRVLSLEAGIGLGFLHTTYEEYLPVDGHYVYQQTSRTNYFGPVKLKFALVWRLWNEKKKGGIR